MEYRKDLRPAHLCQNITSFSAKLRRIQRIRRLRWTSTSCQPYRKLRQTMLLLELSLFCWYLRPPPPEVLPIVLHLLRLALLESIPLVLSFSWARDPCENRPRAVVPAHVTQVVAEG